MLTLTVAYVCRVSGLRVVGVAESPVLHLQLADHSGNRAADQATLSHIVQAVSGLWNSFFFWLKYFIYNTLSLYIKMS